MQRTKLIAAAAALSTVIAAPVLAQDMVQPRAAVPPTNAAYIHRHDAPERYVHRDPGFWPGELAAGVVGGAIGTAGAIASIPFGGPYNNGAYYNGYYNGYGPYASNGYYHSSDFACTPGTYFRGEDGLRHICQ
jgi:hypothetical protein